MTKPHAIRRLGKSIFVPQQARRLRPEEYDVIYADSICFGNERRDTIQKQIRNFAIVLDTENPADRVFVYADRQKDKTGIALSGNEGSGRAVYYGQNFNILGVGKTTLCKSMVPSHSTGKLELVSAMRRIILSRWINRFSQRTPVHPLLIALKETVKVKWNPNPVPASLLVRIDDGSLDRPSHIEQSPEIPFDFVKTLAEYAKLDAECFAHRILQGTWSTGNYSLQGHVIDLEAVSFVKYRGPAYTSSSKYPHNRFGYEGFGLLKILQQLADVKNITDDKIKHRFYQERCKHLGRTFLSLLGIPSDPASSFFLSHQDLVLGVSQQFEALSKKISSHAAQLNLYMPVSDDQDPSLLDMSNLFRNLANLYGSPGAEAKAFGFLIRKEMISRIRPGPFAIPANQAEEFLLDNAVVTAGHVNRFLDETRTFINDLFQLLASLDSEKCLPEKAVWDQRLRVMNQDLPPMFELNQKLFSLAESYRLGATSPRKLGAEIELLCESPDRNRTEITS